MTTAADRSDERETAVTVHYWAARAGRGGRRERGDRRRRAADASPSSYAAWSPRTPAPTSSGWSASARCWSATSRSRTQDPGTVVVRPGDVVELLPPFAGG